jgi:hypothetical protein
MRLQLRHGLCHFFRWNTGQRSRRIYRRAHAAQYRALDGANARTLGIREVSFTLGTLFRVDEEVRLRFIYSVTGTQWLTRPTVHARFNDL